MPDAGATVRRSDEQMSTELDDEVVALHTGRNAFFAMNDVASWMWRLLESPIVVGDVYARLLEEFEVDVDTCQREAGAYLDYLIDKGLVTVVD